MSESNSIQPRFMGQQSLIATSTDAAIAIGPYAIGFNKNFGV